MEDYPRELDSTEATGFDGRTSEVRPYIYCRNFNIPQLFSFSNFKHTTLYLSHFINQANLGMHNNVSLGKGGANGADFASALADSARVISRDDGGILTVSVLSCS